MCREETAHSLTPLGGFEGACPSELQPGFGDCWEEERSSWSVAMMFVTASEVESDCVWDAVLSSDTMRSNDALVLQVALRRGSILDFVMSTQVISNVLSQQLLHMMRYNRRISAQERLGKAVKLLVAVLNNYPLTKQAG